MSGGSFNYVFLDAESVASIFAKIHEVESMENYLRSIGKHDAANEILLYLREMETHARRIETIGKRMSNLMQAAEWTASSDWGPEAIDKAYWELMGIQNPIP